MRVGDTVVYKPEDCFAEIVHMYEASIGLYLYCVVLKDLRYVRVIPDVTAEELRCCAL